MRRQLGYLRRYAARYAAGALCLLLTASLAMAVPYLLKQAIDAIQGDTRGAIDAIAEIATVINQINDISNTIASAVEEQSATTNEISRNVSEAARGSSEIAQNIVGVAQAARGTSDGAAETLRASTHLAQVAAGLNDLVAQLDV